MHTNIETDHAFAVLTAFLHKHGFDPRFTHLGQIQRPLEVLPLQIQHALIWTTERLRDASENPLPLSEQPRLPTGLPPTIVQRSAATCAIHQSK